MTDEQRKNFKAARAALNKMADAIQELESPLEAIQDQVEGSDHEWEEHRVSLVNSAEKIAELLEAEENLKILMGLPERK